MNKITLCMIVKNEEKTLSLCLSSIVAYVDEIVIVDTGSSDKTKEIAIQYTDNVYDFPWINDFSAARNFAVSKASHDFILSLDSDEITETIDMQQIKHLTELYPKKLGRLLIVSEFVRNDNEFKVTNRLSRLFSKKFFKFQGSIHEQLVRIDDPKNEMPDTYDLPLIVKHSGYEGNLEERRHKTERNISLLKIALKNNPEDPYTLYQLGKSYYMQEDYKTAVEYLGQALYFDLDPRLEYVQDIVESYGYSLLNSGRYETALQLLNVYDEFAKNADFVFLTALIYMNNAMFEEAIKEFQKATTMKEAKMDGVNGFRAYYNIGVIYECLGNIEKAKEYYQYCSDYSLALDRLSKL
jgi:Glycosyltransferases involved in cell wall biogenesis